MPTQKNTLTKTFLAALVALTTCLLPASAHTIAIGYVVTGPGDIDVWFGTYHPYADAPQTEGHALLTLPNGSTISDAFTLTTPTRPAGLVLGVNLQFNPNIFDYLTGANATLADILAWQGAPFTGLTQPGTYTIDLDPAFPPSSSKWSNDLGGPISFTINAATLAISIPITALTPNQQAPLQQINQSIANGGTFSNLVIKLMQAAGSPVNLGKDLDQLSPLKFGNFASATEFNNDDFETQDMDTYLASMREGDHGTFIGGNGSIDASGLTVDDANVDPALALVHSRMLAWNAPTGMSDTASPLLGGIDMKSDAKDMKTCTGCIAGVEHPWNVFVRGNVVLAQGFSQADIPHFDDNTESVIIGADYRVTPNFLVGLTAGYAHTDATLDTFNSSATIDSYTPGIYAAFAQDGWYANMLGRYSYNSYTESRNIDFLGQRADGATDGNAGVANLDGGYDFHSGALTYGPSAGVQYAHLTVNSYSESGSDANLAVREDQSDSLRSRLGGSLRYAYCTKNVSLTPHLQASWVHEFMDPSRGLTSEFTNFGGGAFVVRTQDSSSDFALVDAGLDAQINKSVTVFGDYLVQAGQDNYFAQSVQAGVKVNF